MSETCPDTFPEDWANPHVTRTEDYDIKEYKDGIRVIIQEPTYDRYGFLVVPAVVETRYPDRGLHYELGDNAPGLRYYPKGIPEDVQP